MTNYEELRARAGISYLGKYRSSNPKWVRAMRDLSRDVTVPARDRGIERMLGDATAGLVAGRDNRSVTSPEWVAEGLAKYGCPIHSANRAPTNMGGDEFTVSGYGPCACRRNSGGRTRATAVTGTGDDERGPRSAPSSSLPSVLGSDDEGAHPKDRGVAVPRPRVDRCSRGRSGRSWDPGALRDAFRATLATAGDETGGRKPYPLDEVVERFIHPDKFAGAPYFTRNKYVREKGLGAAQRIWAGRRGFDPYFALRRVQPGVTGPKTRLVWGASLPTTIVGTAFSKRVHENLARRRPFAIGLRAVEKGALVSELQSRFRYVYSLDISGFDASAPAALIDDVFRVLRTHLDLDDEARNVWDRYVSDFIHSRIIVHDGTVFQKHKGIPSGSAFTSWVGTVLNLYLMNYVLIRASGVALRDDRVLVMGDDIIFASDTRFDLGTLASYAAELGFIVSVEKSNISDSRREAPSPFENRVHFLGHYWHHGWAHREHHELIRRMVFTERHALRTQRESLIRFYAYLTDAWEAWDIYTSVFGAEDAITSLTRCLDAIGDMDESPRAVDLPGQLRLLAELVREVNEDPLPAKGLVLGMTPLLF